MRRAVNKVRDFLLESEEQLDKEAFAYLKENGLSAGLLPCSCAHYNDRIKLGFFPDGLEEFSKVSSDMSMEEVCAVARAVLDRIQNLEKSGVISLENVVWDMDSIYLDPQRRVFLIALPAVLPPDQQNSRIYQRRVYALMEEIFSRTEGGESVNRQISYQKEKNFGSWDSLKEAIERRMPEEDGMLCLKSVNTPEELVFRVDHEAFLIGSDPVEANGLIEGSESVSPVHAKIGWNEINFYVCDLGSDLGTYVNDQKITPNTEVPIGSGTVLRFGDCTFTVE